MVYAYNTSRHDSTKYIPFEVIFGRQTWLPIDFNIKDRYSPEQLAKASMDTIESSISLQQVKRENIQQNVKINIYSGQVILNIIAIISSFKIDFLCLQKKQKFHFDKKHKSTCSFLVGSLVLKLFFLKQKRRGGKLDERWEGQFQIIKCLGKGFFKLQKVNGDKVIKRVYCIIY